MRHWLRARREASLCPQPIPSVSLYLLLTAVGGGPGRAGLCGTDPPGTGRTEGGMETSIWTRGAGSHLCGPPCEGVGPPDFCVRRAAFAEDMSFLVGLPSPRVGPDRDLALPAGMGHRAGTSGKFIVGGSKVLMGMWGCPWPPRKCLQGHPGAGAPLHAVLDGEFLSSFCLWRWALQVGSQGPRGTRVPAAPTPCRVPGRPARHHAGQGQACCGQTSAPSVPSCTPPSTPALLSPSLLQHLGSQTDPG